MVGLQVDSMGFSCLVGDGTIMVRWLNEPFIRMFQIIFWLFLSMPTSCGVLSIFSELVLSSFSSIEICGRKDFALWHKLKALNLVLNFCNKQVFGNLDPEIDSMKDVVNNVNSLADIGALCVDEIEIRSKVIVYLWSLLSIKRSHLL